MRISGLSNQWKTRGRLYDDFAVLPHDDADDTIVSKYRKIRELFEALEQLDGPDVYIGTSHSLMNFSNRDVVRSDDRTQPFAYVDVAGATDGELCFRTKTRRFDGNRPTTEWITQDIKEAEQVAKLILKALLYADVPPRRVAAQKGG